ncbi:hypothetical protein QP477_10115 [Haemophilus seminalis]|jgi:hypothetical protein|nr:hypothetical protein [Haemophilus seminalis]MDK7281779.1 hypothetical protein [Haemophilus seminalis]
MNRDDAFRYLNSKKNTGLEPEGSNFKIRYEYLNRDRSLFNRAFQLAYGEHGLDVYFNDIHYKVINSMLGLYWVKNGDLLGSLRSKFFGPYYAEVYLMREQGMTIDANNININDVNQIIINTKTITSIKSKKIEIFNYQYDIDSEDFEKLYISIENIENNLLKNIPQNNEDLNILEHLANKYPNIRSLISDIITITSPIISSIGG